MKAITLRPLASFCLVFYFVAAFTNVGDSKLAAIFISSVLCVLLLAGYFNLGKNLYVRALAVITLAVTLSLSFTGAFIDIPRQRALALAGEHQVCGRVTEVEWSASYKGYYIARLSEIDGQDTDLNIVLVCGDALERGDLFSASVNLRPMENDSDFDRIDYYSRMGIYLETEESVISYEGSRESIADGFARINETLSARLVLSMGKDAGGIAASLFLGNKSFLSDKVENALTHMGISHLIALSGLHLTILCTMIGFILRPVNARLRLLLSLIPVIFYILLTGFSASILRAGFMLICMSLVSFMGRASDSPTNLGITLLALTVIDPCSVYDVGLQLSACAMLGIFAYMRINRYDIMLPYSEKRERIKKIAAPFVLGFFAMVFTMPLTYRYFGSFSLLSFILTVPYSIAATAVLWVTPAALLLGKVPLIGSALISVCRDICALIGDTALFMGFENGLTYSADNIAIKVLMVLFILTVSIALMLESKKPRRITAGISAAIFAAFITVTAISAGVSLTQVTLVPTEIPSGDGFVIKSDKSCIMVDISSGSGKMADYLSDAAASLDIYTVDCLIITDPHSRHKNELSRLEEYMDIETVMMPDDETSRQVAKLLGDAEILYYHRGDTLDFGDYSLVTYEDVYLDRSVVPIIRLTVQTEEDSLMYVGSSYNEGDVSAQSCEHIWYGGYGPKYKREFFAEGENVFLSQKAMEFCPDDPAPLPERLILQG